MKHSCTGNIGKRILALGFFILATAQLRASIWIEVSEVEPATGTPEACAVTFIRAAHEDRVGDAADCMTPEYRSWLESIMTLQQSLSKYATADLQQRFAYRVREDERGTTVIVRLFSTTKNREVNMYLKMELTSDGWKLAI